MRAAAAEIRGRTTCWNVTQVTSSVKKKVHAAHVAEKGLGFKSPSFDTAAAKVCQTKRDGKKNNTGFTPSSKCAHVSTHSERLIARSHPLIQ